jgi:hypothetical protein
MPISGDQILICGAMSHGGFFAVLRLIPVAAQHLLRPGY